jgi:hypothetical protein
VTALNEHEMDVVVRSAGRDVTVARLDVITEGPMTATGVANVLRAAADALLDQLNHDQEVFGVIDL